MLGLSLRNLKVSTATDNTAVFKGSKSISAANTGEPARVNITGGAKVQTYEQGGSASTVAIHTSNTLTGDNQPTTWLQTLVLPLRKLDAPIHLTFTDDGARVLAAYDGTTMPTSHTAYVSATLLEGDYATASCTRYFSSLPNNRRNRWLSLMLLVGVLMLFL